MHRHLADPGMEVLCPSLRRDCAWLLAAARLCGVGLCVSCTHCPAPLTGRSHVGPEQAVPAAVLLPKFSKLTTNCVR